MTINLFKIAGPCKILHMFATYIRMLQTLPFILENFPCYFLKYNSPGN